MAEIDVKINYITKGSEVEGVEGTFKCEVYDSHRYVWGIYTGKGTGVGWEMGLTLNDISRMMSSMDGKNHKVFWRKERKNWRKERKRGREDGRIKVRVMRRRRRKVELGYKVESA